MAEVVIINGTPVRAAGVHRTSVARDDGPPLEEIYLTVILRGTIPHRSFQELLKPGTLLFASPGKPPLEATITAASHASSGVGESAAHRHDVTLRETPASAERRAAEAAAAAAAQPEPEPAPPTDEDDDDPDAPLDLSQVGLKASAATMAAALRQLTTPAAAPPAPPPEPPLDPAALAGAEAILVGLRLEALIEALDAAGAVRRSAIDDGFLRLIEDRFVAEATPVIGEAAARRVVRDLLG
jgi:hypothetical protein